MVGYVPVVDEAGEEGFVRIIGRAWYKLLFIVLAVLVCITVFVAGIWFARQDEVPGLDKTAVSYHIDGVKNADSESILLPGLDALKAQAGDPHVKEALINPDGNECYFTYSIKLADTGEELYRSGLIPPGKAVMEFDLNRALSAGEYPIEVIVRTRDLKDVNIEYNAGNIDTRLGVAE
ncbi:hypothetical protein [Eubacterium callanderi]|uniref:hypothetical protein n=1 Tax=Eubacterium callanderi TaxID=53442 RepID=UPI002672AA70|nr:hypothetical protein [Eubacterium callanderi]